MPRAATSHSASVGSRLLTQPQYRTASSQLTHETGQLGVVACCHEHGGATQTPARTHASYACWVTSVSSIEKSETATWWYGDSSAPQSGSPGAHPIMNEPPRIGSELCGAPPSGGPTCPPGPTEGQP